jgi:hypothetical protein
VKVFFFNLETAVGPRQKVQYFELESLGMGAEHSQEVKAAPSQVILALKIVLFDRLQLPFLGLRQPGPPKKERGPYQCLSRVQGNLHAQFLEEAIIAR